MYTLKINWSAWRVIRRKLKLQNNKILPHEQLQNKFRCRFDYCYQGDETKIQITFDLEQDKTWFLLSFGDKL
jgi:hypothetical protein